MAHSPHSSLELAKRQSLTPGKPVARNGAAPAAAGGDRTEHTDKGSLPRFLQLLEHSSDEVAAHEGLESSLGKQCSATTGTSHAHHGAAKTWQCHREGDLMGVLAVKLI